MREIRRFVTLLASVTVLLTAFMSSQNVVLAQDLQPPETLSSSNNTTLSDVEHIVNLAFDEKISVPDLQAFYESLNSKGQQAFAYYVSQKAGIDLTKSSASPSTSVFGDQAAPSERSLPGNPSPQLIGVWTQTIENAWTAYQNGPTANYYYNDANCDENGDPDQDFVFHFPLQSSNPDGIRWTTTASQVYAVFMAAYGGNLKGFAYGWSDTNLCIGPDGVSAAGGANVVASTVFVHY